MNDCTRECPAIEVDTSLGGLQVRRGLDGGAAVRSESDRSGVSRLGLGRLERRTGCATGVETRFSLCLAASNRFPGEPMKKTAVSQILMDGYAWKSDNPSTA